jgi:hypothetical protein
MWWMGVTSWSVLDARVALRLAKSSWVVIRPRFRRWPGMGMGAASGEATWEGMVVGGRWSVFGGCRVVVVVVVVVVAGEVEAWVGFDFPWMRPGGQGGGLPFDVAGEWESTGFF